MDSGADGDCRMEVSTFFILVTGCVPSEDQFQEMVTPGDRNRLAELGRNGKSTSFSFCGC